MPEENYQKIKLLKIMEILRQETDEEHPMTKVEFTAMPSFAVFELYCGLLR